MAEVWLYPCTLLATTLLLWDLSGSAHVAQLPSTSAGTAMTSASKLRRHETGGSQAVPGRQEIVIGSIPFAILHPQQQETLSDKSLDLTSSSSADRSGLPNLDSDSRLPQQAFHYSINLNHSHGWDFITPAVEVPARNPGHCQ